MKHEGDQNMHKGTIFIALVILAGLIQLVPYGRDHNNPNVVAEPQWDSLQTKSFFMRACGDCHSYETKWPWYSNIAPVSWLVTNDVSEGRDHFNVSNWGHQRRNLGDKAVKEYIEGEMPPMQYLPAHPEARFKKSEKAAFINGLQNTFTPNSSKRSAANMPHALKPPRRNFQHVAQY
jgi:hypothetical protein